MCRIVYASLDECVVRCMRPTVNVSFGVCVVRYGPPTVYASLDVYVRLCSMIRCVRLTVSVNVFVRPYVNVDVLAVYNIPQSSAVPFQT